MRLVRPAVIQVFIGTRRSTFKMICWHGAGCGRRSQFFFTDYLSVFKIQSLASSKMLSPEEKQGERHDACYDLGLRVPYHSFHCILFFKREVKIF
jgi:hypothetical protein